MSSLPSAGKQQRFNVVQRKNCTGLPLFYYDLPIKTTPAIEPFLAALAPPKFPLGAAFAILKVDVPGRFLISGLLGTRQLKVLLMPDVELSAREAFESVLAEYIEYELAA